MTERPAAAVTASMLRERMLAELPPRLSAHIDRVVTMARDLAARHDLDVALVALMAQGHDLLRAIPPEELLRRAERRGITIDPVERAVPVLLHGPLAAFELRERFEVGDEQVLDAIRWHSTGHPDFGLEQWACFVADKAEPLKVAGRGALRRVAELAEDSLETAALAFLDQNLARAVYEGWQVHPLAIDTRNALLQRGN